MRFIAFALLTIGLLACPGCDKASGSANGAGTGTSAHARAGISLPF